MLLSFCILSAEVTFPQTIKVLDTKKLTYKELSGLAYKEDKLYIVANNGVLYTFFLKIKNKKITQLQEINRSFLKTKKGKPLKKKSRDAEGICFFGDDLLISFERKPRVELYTTDACKIKKMKINEALIKKENYKSKNKGLEAVAYSKKYGLIALPEQALRTEKEHAIYAKKRSWKLQLSGDIKAIEFSKEDEVLLLVREKNPLTHQQYSFLYSFDLTKTQNHTPSFLLKRQGNFEGLTKVENNSYLMVSDSKGGMFQKAELVLFELND